ncbi:myotubularin-related protein 9-like isoform X2 [Aotus nancymaae]|uniref:myotubularin-related protein 9-like isoform X2 n=1 Tax=Aotus nancymaae TaxID=37293 RepID=UPI0030FEB689
MAHCNLELLDLGIRLLDLLSSWDLHVQDPTPRVAGGSGTITLRRKDLRVLQLEIEDGEATLDIARSFEPLSSLELAITSCPFFYHPKGLRLDDSWHFLSPERYYKRVALETNA